MSAHFIVIGAGGLGCPALLGLVDGGARRLTIIDDDQVDVSNLPRQVLYQSADVGVDKLAAAAWSLRARVRDRDGDRDRESLDIVTHRERLPLEGLAGTLGELAATHPHTIVLECSDSPRLKFAVHDACIALGLRAVIGGVVGWHGQAMAVDPRRRDAACYRCLFEAPPPAELAPACATVGVIGPAAGVVGHAMAMMALALAQLSAPDQRDPGPDAGQDAEQRAETGCAGTIVHFDLLRGTVRRLAPAPRPDCPTCSPAHRNINFQPT